MKRLGSDHGLGKGQWEVERATLVLEGRPEGHADEFEVKEVEEQC